MAFLLVIGVSGSGKSTVGRLLAERLDGAFLDADDYHPEANLRKMSSGIPLGDADRFPWLRLLVETVQNRLKEQSPVVLACSALKTAYRRVFREAIPDLQVIYLKGSQRLIEERMQQRTNHFMKAAMLDSQFADLEEPANAISVTIDQEVPEVVEAILQHLTPTR